MDVFVHQVYNVGGPQISILLQQTVALDVKINDAVQLALNVLEKLRSLATNKILRLVIKKSENDNHSLVDEGVYKRILCSECCS